MSLVLSVNNLYKFYGDYKAVNGISFSVNSGEIFGILGPNGAGKTTSLECIQGIVLINGVAAGGQIRDYPVQVTVMLLLFAASLLVSLKKFRWEYNQ